MYLQLESLLSASDATSYTWIVDIASGTSMFVTFLHLTCRLKTRF